jgi:CheY-like chemotaxis protein
MPGTSRLSLSVADTIALLSLRAASRARRCADVERASPSLLLTSRSQLNIAAGAGHPSLSATVLEVTGWILRKNGFTTLEAGTYEQALSLASSRDFQPLLTDSIMPGMTGATLAERITEMKPGMPVLHMSGYSAGILDPESIRDGNLRTSRNRSPPRHCWKKYTPY